MWEMKREDRRFTFLSAAHLYRHNTVWMHQFICHLWWFISNSVVYLTLSDICMRASHIHYPEKENNRENIVSLPYLITALHPAGLLLIKLQDFTVTHFPFGSNPLQYLWRGSIEGDPHLLVRKIEETNVSIFINSRAKGDKQYSSLYRYVCLHR